MLQNMNTRKHDRRESNADDNEIENQLSDEDDIDDFIDDSDLSGNISHDDKYQLLIFHVLLSNRIINFIELFIITLYQFVNGNSQYYYNLQYSKYYVIHINRTSTLS